MRWKGPSAAPLTASAAVFASGDIGRFLRGYTGARARRVRLDPDHEMRPRLAEVAAPAGDSAGSTSEVGELAQRAAAYRRAQSDSLSAALADLGELSLDVSPERAQLADLIEGIDLDL